MKVFLVATLLVSMTISANELFSQAMTEPDPEPGISRELARWRATHYRDVRYSLNLHLQPGSPLLKGESEIEVTLSRAVDQLVLDWRVQAQKDQPPPRVWDIKANGKNVEDARFVNDHIVIPRRFLVTGRNRVTLKFESPIAVSGSAVTRYLDREDKSEYIYTLFVPSDASTAFPCFDQPDLKARFQLNIAAPTSWKAISNADPQTITRSGTNSFWRFHETKPISTYVFAFAAGEFVEFKDDASQIPMRLFVRKSKAERARKELSEVFRLNREALKFLAAYFDYEFPFSKYDLVIVPEFAYGGMEHAGATFLREESILFPTDPTANDLLSRAELMFHEAAHQWFGDLVTMRWFDDLWLKEGFATFMAYKAIEAIMPEHNAWKAFYQRTKPAAYLTDVTKGTTPIWQEIPNLSAAKSAYGNIVYRKAPSMLRQAEFFLTADKFREAIRNVLKEHAFANAEWADLVRAFEKASGRRLGNWAASWVTRRGMPDVKVDWKANRGGISSFEIMPGDVLGEGGSWPMRVQVVLYYKDQPPFVTTAMIEGAGSTGLKEVVGKPRPLFVFANYGDYGYGRFLLDEESKLAVLNNLGEIKDDFLRALLWGSLWDSLREAQLAPVDYIKLAVRLVTQERDEISVQSILNRVRGAFNYYLSPEQAAELAPSLEQFLSEQMLKADSAGLRITYFRVFHSIATTDNGRETLKKIFRGELAVPGMTVRPRDRFDIATALLARSDKDAPAMLEKLSREDQTDDGRRYAYAAGAAESKAPVKKKYFDDYVGNPNVAESWIEASFGPFNTISQSELTLPYLQPALEQLPVLKRTRKIFFVNGWLSAFIGGQCNDKALKTVNDFLGDQSQLDRDLRLKVLEVSDGLERCVRIRKKYGTS